MNIRTFLLGAVAFLTAACQAPLDSVTGICIPDNGWLFLGEAPYTLTTRVDAAPGPASFCLVTDRSLMGEPEIIFRADATIGPDSTLVVELGNLEPGFYQVRLRDSVRFNIGVQPEKVISEPDAQPDFDAFWERTLAQLETIPLEAEWTEIPEFSNELRTSYDVTYPSLGGATAGCTVCIPNAPGKYPVYIQYMGYGAEPFRFDPSAAPDRIDMLVSVRGQGIFKKAAESWVSQGIADKDTYYYRGAFCDVKRAVDFAASLEKADTDRLVAMGESQGGAFTAVAAALDSRLKVVSLAVPFLGDFPDYAKIVSWPVHEVFAKADEEGIGREELFRTLSYFDVKNFAPRITCPVIMAFGLQDPTCPPHTNFSIYNNLGTKDKCFVCVPTCGHAMWNEPDWPPIRDLFLSEKL